MESVDFLQCARLSILRAEKENGYLDVASILGPAFVCERSANVPPPGLTKAQHGCCGSLSSTNLQYLRATARFSSHFTEICMVDSHGSRRCASHSPHKSSNLRAIYQYVNNRTSPKVCKNHLAGHLPVSKIAIHNW